MRLNAFWGDSRETPHRGGARSLLPSQGSPVPSCGSNTGSNTEACKPRPRESSQLTPGLRKVTNRDLSGPLSPLPENKERRRMRSMNGQQAPPVFGAPGSSLGFPASSPPRHLQRKPERTLRASRTCSLLARGRGGETEAPCGAGGAAAQGAPRPPLQRSVACTHW